MSVLTVPALTNTQLRATPLVVDGSAVTQPVSVAGTVAVSGTMTANIGTPGALALDSSIQAVVTAIKATINLTGTVWYDATVNPTLYYVRREVVNEGTGVISVVWETPSGAAATPTIANLQAVANTQSIVTDTVTYTATAANGSLYSIGDVLIHTFGISTTVSPPAILYSIWLNATTGLTLPSAPTGGSYTQPIQAVSGTVSINGTVPISAISLPLPAGSATSANQATQTTALQAIATKGQSTSANSMSVVLSTDGPFSTNFGASTDTAATSDTGTFSLIALLKRGLQNWTSILARIPVLGQALRISSLPVTIASDQTTIPVVITGPTLGAQTSVASIATDTIILASNGLRKGCLIYNDSTSNLYLLFAVGTSTTSNYSIQIPAGGTMSLLAGEYTGIIKGFWDVVNGSVRITEFS